MATVSQPSRAAAVQRFIKELKKALDEGRITALKLSVDTGISRMQIHRILKGENKPSLETVEKLAKGIGLKIEFVPIPGK